MKKFLFRSTLFDTGLFENSPANKAFAHTGPPVVGVSGCLLGEKVRYDGGDKFQPSIEEHIAPRLTLLPICPELAAGLGVPRPPVQMVQTSRGYRALGVEAPAVDVTESLKVATEQLLKRFDSTELCGFILKSRSPSCGLGSTPLHNRERQPQALGNGLFAHRLRQAYPHLPIVEEAWLEDRARCEWFALCCHLYRGIQRGRLPVPGVLAALPLAPTASAAALLPRIAELLHASNAQIRGGLMVIQKI